MAQPQDTRRIPTRLRRDLVARMRDVRANATSVVMAVLPQDTRTMRLDPRNLRAARARLDDLRVSVGGLERVLRELECEAREVSS